MEHISTRKNEVVKKPITPDTKKTENNRSTGGGGGVKKKEKHDKEICETSIIIQVNI